MRLESTAQAAVMLRKTVILFVAVFSVFDIRASAAQCNAGDLHELYVPQAGHSHSSTWDDNEVWGQSRLDSDKAWVVHKDDTDAWMQLDLGADREIYGVVTMPRGDTSAQKVTAYEVEAKVDGSDTWMQVTADTGSTTFVGNAAEDTADSMAVASFQTSMTARYFRIRPTAFIGYRSMRAGLMACCPGSLLGTGQKYGEDCQMVCDSGFVASGTACCEATALGPRQAFTVDTCDVFTLPSAVDECNAGDLHELYVPQAGHSHSSTWADNEVWGQSRLDSDKAWVVHKDDTDAWMQLDLGADREIYGVVTMPRSDTSAQKVTAYEVEAKVDGSDTWTQVTADTGSTTFVGNAAEDTADSMAVAYFDISMTARYFRIRPTAFIGYRSMRAGLMACCPGSLLGTGQKYGEDCDMVCDSGFVASGTACCEATALGLRQAFTVDTCDVFTLPSAVDECNAGDLHELYVPQAGHSHSSTWADNEVWGQSRLDSDKAWVVHKDDTDAWMQLDLGADREIYGVVTMPRGDTSAQKVTAYEVEAKVDGSDTWTQVTADTGSTTFVGNAAEDTADSMAVAYFQTSMTARYFRIRPTAFIGYRSMRAGLMACCPGSLLGTGQKYAEDPRTCDMVCDSGFVASGTVCCRSDLLGPRQTFAIGNSCHMESPKCEIGFWGSDCCQTALDVAQADHSHSSTWDDNEVWGQSRLDSDKAWVVHKDDTDAWMQLDLGADREIYGVVTMPRGDTSAQKVTAYEVEAKVDGSDTWMQVTADTGSTTFVGNAAEDTADSMAVAYFQTSMTARYFRIRPTAFIGYRSMRVGLVKGSATCNTVPPVSCPSGYEASGFFCCDPAILGPDEIYAVDGTCDTCSAEEGYFCTPGAVAAAPCPGGYYCAGGKDVPEECTCDVGFYCPPVYTPNKDLGVQRRADGAGFVTTGVERDGRRCPPSMYCPGDTAPPVPLPALCDLAQACGPMPAATATCSAAQSTFYRPNGPAAGAAVDGDMTTCMKTADATKDDNAQWVRVDLEAVRHIGTVRFASEGAASDFTVIATTRDFTPVAGSSTDDPTVGGVIEPPYATCTAVATATEKVFEANCSAGTMAQFIFITRARAREILEMCDLQVFAHACLPAAEALPSCPKGSQPAPCAEAEHFCRGCVPCPAGTYSDKEGPYACTPCPGTTAYNERPYSPEGSTAEFQCEGDAFLDGTSTLAVTQVFFDQGVDAWIVDVAVEQAPKIQVNGLSALFLSSGGDEVVAETYAASQFPCRADESRSAGADASAALSETLCCLQDMREGYLMTKVFRDFTDGLDLVAANDRCDAADGSELLVNADLEVWGEGSVFVDVNGADFANPITIEPIEAPAARRTNPEGYTQTQYARITIPDAELYKVSRHSLTHDPLPVDDSTTHLNDQRELFIGLLDMLPTGTRVVDSASQQISITLTRTQYGSFAAYGAQNIDYDFLSYLNARAHQVVSTTESARRGLLPDQFYLEITYVYDDRLTATDEALPVDAPGTVEVAVGGSSSTPCTGGTLPADFATVVGQACGPTELGFGDANECPQVSIPEDHFGRLYIPLDGVPSADVVSVSFKLNLTDANGMAAELNVAVDVVASDFVSWCDSGSGSVNLAERVIPAITIGTETDTPPRLTAFDADAAAFDTKAETLQDGLITLELALNETNDLDDNLEVFMEDVLVIHVNPGSPTTAADIRNPAKGYMPTYTYDPDSRDARLNIRNALREACSNMSHSESFFGCAYKHVLAEEEITNPEWAYKVGSESPTSAQDFMATMLGDGTASVAARELGRDFESALLDHGFATRKKIGLWINPGHKWGQTVHNSKYSLSMDMVIYVLFGVRSGVDGATRRMLLQAGSDGRSAIVQTIKYEVTAASLMESVMEDVVAVEVKARMALPADEACTAPEELRAACAQRLRAAVEPHASAVATVQCVAVAVEDDGACVGVRRASAGDVTVSADAVIALDSTDASSERGVFLDIEAVVESGGVLAMAQAAGRTFEPAGNGNGGGRGNSVAITDTDEDEEGAGGVNVVIIAGAAAAAAVVMVLAFVAKWALCGGRREAAAPLTEVVAAGVVPEEVQKLERPQSLGKNEVENILYGELPASAREEEGDVTIDSLLPRSRPGIQTEFRPLQ